MSFSQLLRDERSPWANVRCENLHLDSDLNVFGDIVTTGGINTDVLQVTDLTTTDLTVEGVLDFGVGGIVDGNVDFTGEISAIGGFRPTGNAGQQSLDNVKKIELDILYVSTIFALGTSLNQLWCVRCGDLITLSFRPEFIGVQAGQTTDIIIADMSLDSGFDEFRPHHETHFPVLFKAPGLNEPQDYIMGSIKLTTTGVMHFNYDIGTLGQFPVPGVGQSTGWVHDISISYMGV